MGRLLCASWCINRKLNPLLRYVTDSQWRAAQRWLHQWNSKAVRSTFIDFFGQKDHLFVPSSSVIPKKNEGTYFVNAGMNQFKPLFLGSVDPASEMATYRRVVNSQKCIRVGGKHNDLDDVGHDTYHHTFFEMLGNWSFADYFKRDACQMAWHLLTDVYKLPASQLYITYFGGNKELGLEPDIECKDIWIQIGVPSERILPFGMKDNFWSMGDTGPCGPCTEIHFNRSGADQQQAAQLVNSGSPDVMELWNLVFMQFDRQLDGSLRKLPAHHVDTGMGLERLVAVLQSKFSNYDTDLFSELLTATGKAAKCRPYRGTLGNTESGHIDAAYRIVADHVRMLTVAIADGLVPGRRESEAKLRHIMYQCFHQATHVLRAKPGLVGRLVPLVIDSLLAVHLLHCSSQGEAFPELQVNAKRTIDIVNQTEQRYLEITALGRKMLQKALNKYGQNISCLSGEHLWEIQEGRFGKAVPADITCIVASELGITADVAEYEKIVQRKNEIKVVAESPASNLHLQLNQHDLELLKRHQIKFTDDSFKYRIHKWTTDRYKFDSMQARVVAILSNGKLLSQADNNATHSTYGVLVDRTPFYATSGGQVADVGKLTSEKGVKGTVHAAHSLQQYVLHTVSLQGGSLSVGDIVTLFVDESRREGCMLNHTATHILNYSLNLVLGDVRQSGSMVNSDRLTFDFTCLKGSVSDDDLQNVTNIANELITSGLPVYRATVPLHLAKSIPDIVFMSDEVYPSDVHVVSIGVPVEDLISVNKSQDDEVNRARKCSVELCGGTHVENSGHLKAVVITNFQGSLQGTKRINAITGHLAVQALDNARALRNQLKNIMIQNESKQPLSNVRALLQSIEQNLSEGVLLSKVDRDHIRHEVEKLMRLSGVSEQQNKNIRSDLQQVLKETLQCSDGVAPIIAQFRFSKTRDMLDALVQLSPNCPLLLLSSPSANGDSILGIAYVPECILAEGGMNHTFLASAKAEL